MMKLMKLFGKKPGGVGGGVSFSGEVSAIKLPLKRKDELQTNADRLDYLCYNRDATYERHTLDNGEICMVLVFGNGDRVSGRGPTTDAALKALAARLGEEGLWATS